MWQMEKQNIKPEDQTNEVEIGNLSDKGFRVFIQNSVSIVSPFICHEVMGPDAMILVF